MGFSSSVTIGYKYYMGMHMVICHGPVDAIHKIYVGERIAKDNPISYDGVEPSIKPFLFSVPNLFGGDREEGGIAGPAEVMFGAADQDRSSYLLAQDGVSGNTLPNFRGVLSLVLKRTQVSAMTPYVKPFWFRVQRIPAKDWYSATASISPVDGESSANGAHILYETLTNSDWGLGYSTALIDDDTFKTAADTLWDEDFGLSMILSGQGTVQDFAQEVLRHINGMLYMDRISGQFVLKLIRDDYSVPALPVFDESNVIELNSFQRPSYAEIVNEIVIVYRQRGDTKDSVVTVQNLASIQAQGEIISQKRQFPGIDSRQTAEKVASRELKQQSTLLAQVVLTVNRDAWGVDPGDPIVLNWPTLGIDTLVLRVVSADYGRIQDGKITLRCVEDVFGLPSASYVSLQDPTWTDPIGDPVPVTTAKLSEATYFEIATGYVGGSVILGSLTPTTSYLLFLANKPGTSANYELWARPGTDPYQYRVEGDYTPNVDIINELYYTDTTDIDTTTMPFEASYVRAGDYAFINDEIVRIDAIDVDNNLVTIGRGCIDTIPAIHPAGSTLWFGKNLWGKDLTEFGAETINAKALPRTGTGILEIGSATEETITLVGRQYKPYPVADVTQGDEDWSFPQQMYGIIGTTPGIRFNWSDRNRLQQTVPYDIQDWFDASITIEPSTTYELSLYGERNLYKGADRVVDPATGNQYDWVTEKSDSGIPIYDPVGFHTADILKHPDLAASLANASRYKLGTSGSVDSTNDITFTGGFAHFNGTSSYIEVSNAIGGSLTSAFSVIFDPEDSGDEEQTIFAIYGDLQPAPSPAEWGPLLSISWVRSTNAIEVRVDADYLPPGSSFLGYARPGVKNELFVVFEEPIYDGADPPGEPSIRAGTVRVYMNGLVVTTTKGSLWGLTGADKPWTLGSGWNVDESTREKFFKGRMTDLRFWRSADAPASISTSDVWDSTRTRANESFRTKIVTTRDVQSLQTYDFTVPYRAGWGMNWGNDWNGRF